MAQNDSLRKYANYIMESYPGSNHRDYELDTAGLSNASFGKEIRDKEFALKKTITFINHGSYGTVPRRLLDIQTRYLWEREEQPDLWFRFHAKHYVERSTQAVADFIGADVSNVLLLSNTTSALNIIVRSYPFKAGDAILDTNLSYGAIKNMCYDFTTRIRPDVKRVQLQVNFPIDGEESIVEQYEDILKNNPAIKMVILDHITSPTSIIMPVRQIVDVCHKHGALVVIDGAHAVGQLPLNVPEIGADIYTSNMHKWLYTPRGSSFLWFDSKHESWINPSNTSWQLGLSLDKQFFDQGTCEHIPFICARHALEFYTAIGGLEKIVAYTSELAEKAKEIFVTELGLETLQIPESLEAPNMKLIKLPAFPKFPRSLERTWGLQNALFAENNIFGIVFLFSGSFYVRLSFQVYNDVDDLRTVAKVMRDFIDKNI
ncbi:unnamed protein product [Candidula unifasciata]|uniref:Aminotransferase class V domain-containing protein n=1 Tax=Candidula unifasciata TaxID=100452 RepID=A0A8S3ZYW8_9EUPU|nr:unnamed protein product [Candidula unifasciata]